MTSEEVLARLTRQQPWPPPVQAHQPPSVRCSPRAGLLQPTHRPLPPAFRLHTYRYNRYGRRGASSSLITAVTKTNAQPGYRVRNIYWEAVYTLVAPPSAYRAVPAARSAHHRGIENPRIRSKPLTRRSALSLLAVTGGATLLAACGAQPPGNQRQRIRESASGSASASAAASKTARTDYSSVAVLEGYTSKPADYQPGTRTEPSRTPPCP